MRIIVTIPAYNEERTIGSVIDNIHRVMKKNRYDYGILVVNDGSKDNTEKVASEHKSLVFSHPQNRGLAETFRTEMERCISLKADIIVHTDADGQYLAEDMPKLIKKVMEGYDLVLGSRFKGKIESMPLTKRLGNMAFSKVISSITKMKISDGQTGFRAFKREVAENINITSNYTYTQEQIIRAARSNYRIIEVPIFFAKRKGRSKSRLMKNPFDYAARAGINLIRVYRDYEPLKFFVSIGSVIFLFGLFIGIYFIYLNFTTGINGHIGLLFLMIILIFSGIQISMFGFLADMFKK